MFFDQLKSDILNLRSRIKSAYLEKAMNFSNLQTSLFEISDDNFSEVISAFEMSDISSSSQTLCRLVKYAISIRPKSSKLFACFIKHFVDFGVNGLSPLFLRSFFINNDRKMAFMAAWDVNFISECLDQQVFTESALIKQIIPYAKVSKQNFSISLLYMKFQELIESKAPQIIEIMKHALRFSKEGGLFTDLLSHQEPDSLAECLKSDNIEAFQEYASAPDFDFNQIIPCTRFEDNYFSSKRPQLIDYAAYYGSIKCFKFLLLNHAELEYRVVDQLTFPQCVIAGGHLEIVRILEQNNCDFNKVLHIAAQYHRNEIFDWLVQNKFPDLSTPEHVMLLTTCAVSNNIPCIITTLEHNANPYDLSMVAAFKALSFEAGFLLASIPTTDINQFDANMTNSLMYIALGGNEFWLREFLKNDRVDLMSVDSMSETCVHYAVRGDNVETLHILLGLEQINVNQPNNNVLLFLLMKLLCI